MYIHIYVFIDTQCLYYIYSIYSVYLYLYHHIVATIYTRERERDESMHILELLVCTLRVCVAHSLRRIGREHAASNWFFPCQVFSPRSAKLALGLCEKSGKSG